MPRTGIRCVTTGSVGRCSSSGTAVRSSTSSRGVEQLVAAAGPLLEGRDDALGQVGGGAATHHALLVDEQGELGAADRRLGVGGDLREHVVELQLRDEILHRRHQQVGDLGALVDLLLHQGEALPALGDRAVAGDDGDDRRQHDRDGNQGGGEDGAAGEERQCARGGPDLHRRPGAGGPVDVEDAFGVPAADAAWMADPGGTASRRAAGRTRAGRCCSRSRRGGRGCRGSAGCGSARGCSPTSSASIRCTRLNFALARPMLENSSRGEPSVRRESFCADADVGRERGRADPLGDVRVVEHLGRRLEEVDPELIREPGVVVSEIGLTVDQPGSVRAAPRRPCGPLCVPRRRSRAPWSLR